MAPCQASKSQNLLAPYRPANPVLAAHKTHISQAWCCSMRRHIADVQCSRQDGGAGRALRHLGILVTSFPLWKSWQHFVLPGARPPKNNFLPVRRITKISTVHLFILNLTRAVWGLPGGPTYEYKGSPLRSRGNRAKDIP